MLWMQSVPSASFWKPLARVAALGVVWVFTAGANSCSTGTTEPRFVTDLVLKNAAGQIRTEFADGEPITLELGVRNRSNAETVLQFGSGHQFEFLVVDAGSSEARWMWSSDKAFIQATTELVFAPGQTHTFETTWDQVDDDGRAVGPGNYEARGVLLYAEFATSPLTPHQLGSPLKPFTIN